MKFYIDLYAIYYHRIKMEFKLPAGFIFVSDLVIICNDTFTGRRFTYQIDDTTIDYPHPKKSV